MAWNLEEFFKDKRDCLNSIERLKKISEKILIYDKSDLKSKSDVIKFLKLYKTYSELEYEFLAYFDLLEIENYENPNLTEYRGRLKKISTSLASFFNSAFEKINDDNLLELYNVEDEYKKIFDNYVGSLECETIRHINTFNALNNDVTSLNLEPEKFKHSFLEIINNYFASFLDDDSYEDIVFSNHLEIEKSDLRRLFKILGQNSHLNLNYCDILLENEDLMFPKISYESAKERNLKSYKIFGDEYLNLVKDAFNSNRIDYKLRKNKSNANVTFPIKKHNAFVSINYNEDIESVLTLSHELGHMVDHDIKLKNNRDSFASTANELFSLTNELITGEYLLSNSNTLEEKICVSLELMEIYMINIFETISTVDLTLRVNRKILKDGYIDLKSINNMASNIIKKYNLISTKYFWIDERLFEMLDQIVYTYGMIGASNINNCIKNKTFSIKDYIEALKKSDDEGFEIYDMLGCNPIDENNVNNAVNSYKNLLENTKDLVYEKKKRR